MKEVQLDAKLNILEDGDFKCDDLDSYLWKYPYTRRATGRNTIKNGDPEREIEFEGITLRTLILRNRGDSGSLGTLDFKISGASSGSIGPGGVLILHDGNITDLKVSTTNVNEIDYEYVILG